MATKGKKAKAKRTASQANGKLKLPVTFGGVSFGKKNVRIGVTVERSGLSLTVADKTFCDRRLDVIVMASGEDDQRDQGRLPGLEDDIELGASADAKGFSVHTETITFGLTFNRVDLNEKTEAAGIKIQNFAAREGYIKINAVEEIPEEEKKADDDPPADNEATE